MTTATITRRTLLLGGAAFAVASTGLSRAFAAMDAGSGTAKTMQVFASPTCGCCKGWVDHVRANGFAFVEGGLISGVSSLAVPVFSAARGIEGAISMLFPTGRFQADKMPSDVLAELQQCAVDIGAAG